MENWEFLIQREGDCGWRSIKTGNLQLMEGKYRIVANTNLSDTWVKTWIAHQSLGATAPPRRSQPRDRLTNTSGILLIIPFTHLQSGIWQFVCSRTTIAQMTWHKILKLRVLPRSSVTDPRVPLQVGMVSNLESAQTHTLAFPVVGDAIDLPTPDGAVSAACNRRKSGK